MKPSGRTAAPRAGWEHSGRRDAGGGFKGAITPGWRREAGEGEAGRGEERPEWGRMEPREAGRRDGEEHRAWRGGQRENGESGEGAGKGESAGGLGARRPPPGTARPPHGSARAGRAEWRGLCAGAASATRPEPAPR